MFSFFAFHVCFTDFRVCHLPLLVFYFRDAPQHINHNRGARGEQTETNKSFPAFLSLTVSFVLCGLEGNFLVVEKRYTLTNDTWIDTTEVRRKTIKFMAINSSPGKVFPSVFTIFTLEIEELSFHSRK
jgi:hypothetical protein